MRKTIGFGGQSCAGTDKVHESTPHPRRYKRYKRFGQDSLSSVVVVVIVVVDVKPCVECIVLEQNNTQMSSQVLPEYNANGAVVGYSCARLVSPASTSLPAKVPYYYDLQFPCAGETPEDAMTKVQPGLLRLTAAQLKFLDADQSGCWGPQDEGPWIVAVRSERADQLEAFDCLKTPSAAGQCCKVVSGEMSLYPIGSYEDDDLRRMVGNLLVDATIGGFHTEYLGAEVDASAEGGRDNVAPALSQPDEGTVEPEDREMTVVGGFVAGGLIAVFIGMALMLVQRRRRHLRGHGRAVRDSDDVTVHVSVMSPEETRKEEEAKALALDEAMYGEANFPNYQFDVGDSFKNEIAGKYGSSQGSGPSSIPVVPPYPMEETSDSEVDSWAQTDGTVGSLEERLEEITAEI